MKAAAAVAARSIGCARRWPPNWAAKLAPLARKGWPSKGERQGTLRGWRQDETRWPIGSLAERAQIRDRNIMPDDPRIDRAAARAPLYKNQPEPCNPKRAHNDTYLHDPIQRWPPVYLGARLVVRLNSIEGLPLSLSAH